MIQVLQALQACLPVPSVLFSQGSFPTLHVLNSSHRTMKGLLIQTCAFRGKKRLATRRRDFDKIADKSNSQVVLTLGKPTLADVAQSAEFHGNRQCCFFA